MSAQFRHKKNDPYHGGLDYHSTQNALGSLTDPVMKNWVVYSYSHIVMITIINL